jgi:hypothetical protein
MSLRQPRIPNTVDIAVVQPEYWVERRHESSHISIDLAVNGIMWPALQLSLSWRINWPLAGRLH